MKIARLADESLLIHESWWFLRTGCVMGGVLLPVLILLAELDHDSIHSGRMIGGLLGGFALLWLAAVVPDRRFVFAAANKILTWEQKNWFGVRGGNLPFSDIQDVLVTSENSRDNDCTVGGYNVTYSVALVTKSGTMPLTGTFGHSQHEYRELAATILSVLAIPDETPPASGDEVRRLIAAGRTLEAVTLIRSQQGLGLTEAREMAARIQQTQAAAGKRIPSRD